MIISQKEGEAMRVIVKIEGNQFNQFEEMVKTNRSMMFNSLGIKNGLYDQMIVNHEYRQGNTPTLEEIKKKREELLSYKA